MCQNGCRRCRIHPVPTLYTVPPGGFWHRGKSLPADCRRPVTPTFSGSRSTAAANLALVRTVRGETSISSAMRSAADLWQLLPEVRSERSPWDSSRRMIFPDRAASFWARTDWFLSMPRSARVGLPTWLRDATRSVRLPFAFGIPPSTCPSRRVAPRCRVPAGGSMFWYLPANCPAECTLRDSRRGCRRQSGRPKHRPPFGPPPS
jgi:hypothetical protein